MIAGPIKSLELHYSMIEILIIKEYLFLLDQKLKLNFNKLYAITKITSSIMDSKPEPTIWSRDTGRQIPCFNSCQLTIVYMPNIKDTPLVMILLLTHGLTDIHVTSNIFEIDGL